MVQPTATSITVTWDPPLDANGIVSSYEAVLTDNSNTTITLAVDAFMTAMTFTGLVPFTSYSVTVHPFTGASTIVGNGSTIAFMTSVGSECFRVLTTINSSLV